MSGTMDKWKGKLLIGGIYKSQNNDIKNHDNLFTLFCTQKHSYCWGLLITQVYTGKIGSQTKMRIIFHLDLLNC